MNTTGIFQKNGFRYEPSGFTNYESGLWHHKTKKIAMVGGNWFGVLKRNNGYVPVVNKKEYKPYKSLTAAKQKALVMAIDEGVVITFG